ncbi:hypothetical protein HDU92_001038 [Lobulomyces angularis]|nr:hypothetical protein HDU92_001038 [Lobulomyces angularis]
MITPINGTYQRLLGIVSYCKANEGTQSTVSTTADFNYITMDYNDLNYIYTILDQSEPILMDSGKLETSESIKVDSDPSFFSYFWSGTKTTNTSSTQSVKGEIKYMLKFIEQLTALKLLNTSTEHIKELETLPQTKLKLKPLLNLKGLELNNFRLSNLSDLLETGFRLKKLIIKNHPFFEDEVKELLKKNFSTANDTQEKKEFSIIFPNLSHLSLNNLDLKSLPENLLENCSQLVQLNLQDNKLDSIPIKSLAALSSLHDLNLKKNDISTLKDLKLYKLSSQERLGDTDIKIPVIYTENHVVNRVLVNLVRLNLSKNYLENLEGIENLNNLKFLDISENGVWDVWEVGRLAVLEHIQEVSVKGNPLTKLENYRVNIFTYFKSKAFSLSLDGVSPTSSEYRSIRSNFIIESSSVPTDSTFYSTSPNSSTATADVRVKGKKKKHSHKKAVKRVVIKSSEEEGVSSNNNDISSTLLTENSESAKSCKELINEKDFANSANFSSPALDQRKISTTSTTNPSVSILGEVLRRKFESMKDDNGSNWIQVYSDTLGILKPHATNDTVPEEQLMIPSSSSVEKVNLDDEEVLQSDDTKNIVGYVENKKEDTLIVDDKSRIFNNTIMPAKRDSEKVTVESELENTSSLTKDKLINGNVTSKTTENSNVVLLPKSSNVGSISQIGPGYRKLFEFGPRKDESSPQIKFNPTFTAKNSGNFSSRIETGSLKEFTGLGKIKEDKIFNLPPLVVLAENKYQKEGEKLPSPPFAYGSQGTLGNGSNQSGSVSTPPLILSRPVSSSVKYTKSNFGGSSKNGYSVAHSYSSFHPTTQYGGGSFYSAEAANHAQQRNEQYLLPRSPSIPFLKMTNSLQLHLNFNVFESDKEKILSWIPGSYVKQLPTNLRDGPNGSFGVTCDSKTVKAVEMRSKSKLSWLLSTLCKTQDSKWLIDKRSSNLISSLIVNSNTESNANSFLAIEKLKYLVPIEKPSYFLLTNFKLYIFVPKFSFPYHSDEFNDPYAQFVNNSMQQVRYEDPSKSISLKYIIPLLKIVRIDVGPNYQYLVIHFWKNKDKGTKSSGNENTLHSVENHLPFHSLTLVTRDKIATLKFLKEISHFLHNADNNSIENDSITCNDENTTCSKFSTLKHHNSKININFDWYINSLQEEIYYSSLKKLKKNENVKFYEWFLKNNVVFNSKLDFKSIGIDEMHLTSNRISNIKGGWFGLFNVPFSSSTNDKFNSKKDSVVETPNLLFVSEDEKIDEEKPSIGIEDESLELYLHVGWVVALEENLTNTSPLIRTTALIATNEYLYLVLERLDVWPPLYFPPESSTSANSSNSVLNLSCSQEELNQISSKGLVADLISPFAHYRESSSVLSFGRVKDIVKVERWRSWRWTPLSEVKQIGVEASNEACVMQNGCIGICPTWKSKSGSSTENKHRDISDSSISINRRAADKNSFRKRNLDESIGTGNAAGWSWWIRIYLRQQITPDTAIQSDLLWWDLLFVNLDAADEFITYLRRVRKINSDSQDMQNFTDSDALLDYKDSKGLIDTKIPNHGDISNLEIKECGVELIIGDD